MSQPLESMPTTPEPFELAAMGNTMFAHAHPDDESVTTGAAIELLSHAGRQVYIAIATDGRRSTKGDPHFVTSGGRRSECQAACGKVLGVPLERQMYFGLPDGELSRVRNQLRLAEHLGACMVRYDIRHLVTPGIEGFDGHPDHIAVHRSALLASAIMWLRGRRIRVWALRPDNNGAIRVPVNPGRKQSAINHYASQFSKDPEARAAQLATYQRLMHDCESYSPVSVRELFTRSRRKSTAAHTE